MTKNQTLENIKNAIKNFPAEPGLYLMKDQNDVVLYIGKAKNLRSRVASYFQPSTDIEQTRSPKIAEMLKKVKSVDFLQTKSEIDAILQEARLIKDIRPAYNTALVDDKTFPYLEITKQDFPGIYITRKPQKGSKLFGPFTAASDLRPALIVLQKIFKFRTCRLDISNSDEKRKFFRPCILYNINQCTAPCADKISKKTYRKSISDLIRFLNSNRTAAIAQLNRQMKKAAQDLDFERAAILRDRINLIEKLSQRGNIEDNLQPEAFAYDATQGLEAIQKILNIDQPIRIIEGFDIAHLQGSETVGSLVKFIDGRPFKNGYRRFKIKTVDGIDDYASIYEVITRRYKNAKAGEELIPDLILIDGGLGQLNAAMRAFESLNTQVPIIISLAKKNEEIYSLNNLEPIRLGPTNPARKLLQHIRDEAHRFAQHYHHILRNKKLYQ